VVVELVARRRFGRAAAEGVMVGQAGGTKVADVAAGRCGWSVVQSEAVVEPRAGVVVRDVAARLAGQSGAVDAGLGTAEYAKQTVAVVNGRYFAVNCQAGFVLGSAEAFAVVGSDNSGVVARRPRFAHAAARFEAEDLARFVG
jgi:hypothetical protein